MIKKFRTIVRAEDGHLGKTQEMPVKDQYSRRVFFKRVFSVLKMKKQKHVLEVCGIVMTLDGIRNTETRR